MQLRRFFISFLFLGTILNRYALPYVISIDLEDWERGLPGGSNVRRTALIRPAIKLGLHWIGRTVYPGAKWIHIAEITAATMA